LAIIGSRICSELYTASSQTKSEAHRMKVLGKLDTHLQRWRDAVPIDIRPEHPIKCSNEQYVPILMMHLVYLDAVILLHRLSGHQESFNGSQAPQALNSLKNPLPTTAPLNSRPSCPPNRTSSTTIRRYTIPSYHPRDSNGIWLICGYRTVHLIPAPRQIE
jgi:hypothetical protein